MSFFVWNKYGEYRSRHTAFLYNLGTLVAAHDAYLAEKQKHNYLTKGEYEEYYVNAVRPYFMTDTTGKFSPRIIATDMHKNGVFTHLEYKDIISREGADISDRDSNAAKYLRQRIQEKGYDSIVYMNEKADSGSMGVIVLEPSQLTLVSIDGKPIDENISLENVEESGYNEKGQLTETEKLQLKEKTGWSDDIVDYIGSMKEAQIYINADLKEAKINGKKCLISDDINLQQKNKFGISNMELLSKGYAPVTKDGEKIELHHIGQTQNSPLVELVEQDHRGKINDKILHNKRKKSEINRLVFAVERKKHWKIRPNYINSLIIGDNYEN